MAASIKTSVGRNGKNAPDDVKTIQSLLNAFAGKVKFSKLKVDGQPSGNLEKAIGVFQEQMCGFKPDCRVDPGKQTIKKLAGGPAKAEAEKKAEKKKFDKTVDAERSKMQDQIRKIAEKQASSGGLPKKAVDSIIKGVEKYTEDQWQSLVGKDPTPDQFNAADLTRMAGKVVKAVEGNIKNTVKTAAKARNDAMAMVQKTLEKQAEAVKSTGQNVKDLVGDVADFADSVWDSLFGKDAGKGGTDEGGAGKIGEELGKELGKKVGDILKDIEKNPGETGPDDKVPLILTAAEEAKISSACYKISVMGKSPDPKSKVLLCLNKKENNVDITKGYNKAAMLALFKLIDDKSLWGKKVDFFAMETTNGKPDPKTKSNVVTLRTPVEPFKGTISYTGIGGDSTLKYTGNGSGRMLSYTKVNGWYFFKYGGKFERDPAMRGFDCITYVGTANKVSSGMDGRGDKLANKLGASQVEMEDKSSADVIEYFKGDGKSGKYIGWWSTHCFVILNGTVHEWSQSAGGYRTTKATSFGWKSSGNYVRQL